MADTRLRLPRAEREQQLLELAHARFARVGYAATTMDDVAADAGVTKPLLYTYFGNKERLYLACVERDGAALEAHVHEAFTSTGDPADALRAGLRAFLSFLDADKAAWQVLFDETLPAGGELAVRVAEHRERLTTATATALARALPHRDGVEHEGLAHALLGAAEAYGRWWLRSGNGLTAPAAADLFISTVEPGLVQAARRRNPKETPTDG